MPHRCDTCLNSFGEFYLNNKQAAEGCFYTMYPGTTQASARSICTFGFHQSEDGMLRRGVYLSRDVRKAGRYPIGHPEWDKVVIKVKVNVGRVIAITKLNHRLQKTWHDHEYHTAWVPPDCGMTESGLEEDTQWPCSKKVLGSIPGLSAWSLHVLPVHGGFSPGTPVSSHNP
uniref:PARP catalytic domain-containing protein n=1 Tax=Poecilia reticulata TaxID=8081 RepID=A0A3P9PEL3_POERE